MDNKQRKAGKIIPWLASQALFWMGDGSSRLIRRFDFLAPILGSIYQGFMSRSVDLSDKYDLGVWEKVG